MGTVQFLGEDGLGFELARRIEGCGAWRAWLGESGYAGFANSLASPSAWEAFMSCDPKPTRAQIHLQLRVRALLYDKASVSLLFRGSSSSSSRTSSSASLSNLNPTYLQLHGDDVYFPLEDERHDGIPHHDGSGPLNSTSKTQPRPAFGLSKPNEHCYERASNVASRYNEPETETMVQRPRNDELPESWYSQCIEKYKSSRQLRFPFGGSESHKRTSEAMSAYLKLLEIHKKRRQAFKDDNYTGTANSMWESGTRINPNAVSDMNYNHLVDDETCFLPEIMFPLNCVPDNALPLKDQLEENQNVDVYGVLDTIPQVICRSPAMLERFGVKPEYLRMGLGRSKYRGKAGPEGSQKLLTQEKASKMSQKVVARVLANVGIEGGTEVSMEVLSQVLSNHISKLGRTLKLLTDSYRKQFSSTELLKMFLQTAGFSNLGTLAHHLKDSNKVISHQTLQHGRTLQAQHQNHLLQAQQQQHMQQRQMQPQMSTLHSQTLAFQQQQQLQQQQQQQQQQIQQQQQQQLLLQRQQQWDKMRQRQAATPRGPGMTSEKDRTMVEVKIENMMESPMDGTFNTLNKQQVQQFRNQQIAMANLHAQSGHQFKQMASVQVPQHQPQSPFSMRTPPVKVEGFQELVGGDSTLSHESDERSKLTSPTP